MVGYGEEGLHDHGVGTGGEVRLRCRPAIGRSRRGDRLLPARGAGELEPREGDLVAPRDWYESIVVLQWSIPGARSAAVGGRQAESSEASGAS